MSIHINIIPNRTYKPTILLRKACREGKKVHRDTLAKLTKWPDPPCRSLKSLAQRGVVFEDPYKSQKICCQ